MRWSLLLPLLIAGPVSAQTLVPNDLVYTNNFVSGLSGPVGAEFLPDGRLVIIQQTGQIRVRPAAGGALIAAGTIPVDVSSERGLLGLAVDPDFANSRRLYFYYSEGGNADDRHRVAWATIDAATSLVDVAGRTVILSGMYGPANHNGGGLAFGPDGLLYVGVGDTGCNCNCAPGSADNWFATCLTNLNGKILRVDRNGNIPASNPLVGQTMVPACGPGSRPENSATNGCNAPLYQTMVGAPRTEIYNWGFRNPWRFAFDPLPPHHLWIGDVGEVTWEEITISTGAGQHHGWPFREGAHGDARSSCPGATPQASGDCVEPAFEYAHNGGSGSITGGVFTTHCSWPQNYQGRYWFADYTTDQRAVWTVVPNATRDGVVAGSRQNILTNLEGIVHLTIGRDGAVYLVNANFGRVERVAPMSPASCAMDAGVADGGPRDAGTVADAGGGDVGGVVVDSGVRPDAAPVFPDAAPVLPDAAPTFPDAAPVFPDAAPAFPDAAPAMPDAAPAMPDAAPAMADAEDATPASEDATPFAEDATPASDDASAAPDDATAAPDDASSRPDATAARDASAADAPNSTTDDAEGCGCTTTSDDGAPARATSLAFAALFFAFVRRRRA